jgi:hypothetical protein
MFLTGFLTAGVAFAVYLYVLKTETGRNGPHRAFAVLVFAELLRSFGAAAKPSPSGASHFSRTSTSLIVVAISFGLQMWSHHNAILGRFLKTSPMPLADCFLLLAVGAIPLLVLELVKVVRLLKPRQRSLVRVPAAVEVNDGTAENAVEPCHGVFLLSWLSGRSEGFDQAVLHNVFCQMQISNAFAGERYEGFQVRKQRIFSVLHRL